VAASAWQNLRRLSRPEDPAGRGDSRAIPRERHLLPILPLACGVQRSSKT
jgi:hypothetical protein